MSSLKPDTRLSLSILPDTLAICRLASSAPMPDWANESCLISVTRTPEELSIVCAEQLVPAGVRCEKGWRCFQVKGPLDLSLTGVIASLAAPLAQAKIAMFAISTFDTDYVLVRADDLKNALFVLHQAGHHIEEG